MNDRDDKFNDGFNDNEKNDIESGSVDFAERGYSDKDLREKIQERRKKRQARNKRKNRLKILRIFVLLAAAAAAAAFLTYFWVKGQTLESLEEVNSFFDQSFERRRVYFDGDKKVCLFEPVFQNDDVYVELSFINSNLYYNAVYDRENDILSVATELERVKFLKDANYYFVNGEKVDFGKPAFLDIEDRAFLSGSVIEKFYNVDLVFSPEYKTVCFEDTLRERTVGFMSDDRKLLNAEHNSFSFSDNIENDIEFNVSNGDSVLIYGESDGFAKIRTEAGVVGFVEADVIKDKVVKEPLRKVKAASRQVVSNNDNGKTIILFEQISNTIANANSTKNEIPAGVDVLVPTWFSFKDVNGETDGTIISLADKNYVDFAHSKGRKVWGLITDNFKSAVSRSIVKSAVVREKVVNQISAFVKQYGLDGVNIDFENIPQDSMREFTQFLRELSASLNNLNVTLSIDVYIPRPWSSYYNRGEFGEIVDYFIVMGYDEHTDNSEETGSVATKEWSEESISLTEEEGVPKEKIILAIPFYTRLWKENSDGTFDSRACGMAEGYRTMTEKGASFKWNADLGQNYAEISDGGSTYKMWLEDEKSVEERMKIIKQYDIAGVAPWRRGLEKPEVWPVIKKYMKG